MLIGRKGLLVGRGAYRTWLSPAAWIWRKSSSVIHLEVVCEYMGKYKREWASRSPSAFLGLTELSVHRASVPE